MTDLMELADRLEGGSDRFLKWAYKQPYSGAPVISIPRHPDNIDAILTEAAACIREMVEWRPIETAPRDRTLILCFYPDRYGQNQLSLRYWAVGDWPSSGRTEGWSDQYRQLRKTEPTHWLPLPPAPGAEA